MKAEIACIIDQSGSMASIKNDAIGGFNTFLQEQKRLPGEATLTLVLFDHEYQIVHQSVPLQSVPELTHSTYTPRGTTALLDAIGRTINSVGARLDAMTDKPEKVIVTILTDGMENASHEFTREKVAEMIRHQQEVYSWEFIFLAANQDAFAAGAALNIPTKNTANFAANSAGTRGAYVHTNNLVAGYRAGA